jgi:hypothetical protein
MFNAKVEARTHVLSLRTSLGSLLNGGSILLGITQTSHEIVVELSFESLFVHSEHDERLLRVGLLLRGVVLSHCEDQDIPYFVLGSDKLNRSGIFDQP